MSVVLLEKPGLVEVALVGSDIGKDGTTFFIKAWEATFDTGSPAADATGDGDPGPCFVNGGLLYSDIVIRGAMVASQAMGLASIVDDTKNPATVSFVLGATRKLDMNVLVERYIINWNRKGPWVGIAITAKMSGTAPGTLESAVV